MEWKPIETAPLDRLVLIGWDDTPDACRARWDGEHWQGYFPPTDNEPAGYVSRVRYEPTHWTEFVPPWDLVSDHDLAAD